LGFKRELVVVLDVTWLGFNIVKRKEDKEEGEKNQ